MMAMAANSLISPRTSRRINELLDAGLIRHGNQRLVFGVSSHVSDAHSIGRSDSGWTAVCAAINHVAAAGAEPIGIAVALVMAAEVDTARRDEVLKDAAEAARTADVPLAIQDAELVPAGELNGIHITAFAIGTAPRRPRVHPDYLQPGDLVLVNASPASIRSNVAPLNRLMAQILKEVPGVIFICDASRRGMGQTCCDVAARTGLQVRLNDGIHDDGDDGNGGNTLFFVRPSNVDRALEVLRRDKGEAVAARLIGRIENKRDAGPATAAIGKTLDRELETLPMPRPPALSDTTSAANVTA
jgi:hydrogenase maturation factor